MTTLLASAAPARLPAFKNPQAFGSELEELLKSQREAMQASGVLRKPDAPYKLVVPKFGDTRLFRTPSAISFAEKVFNALVELKVSVAQYAMHLKPEVRSKLFADLDDVLNINDWHEDDVMPRLASFLDFLKWTIFSKRFNWASIGFSDDGSLLVAWLSENGQLTARYDGAGRVWWTSSIREGDQINHAAGDATLEYFEREARRID
jgi:hypothetical protein